MHIKNQKISKTSDADLTQITAQLSRELRFRWHKGLEALCQLIEQSCVEPLEIVAWESNKLYLRISNIENQVIHEILTPAAENLETKYPMSLYDYVYDPLEQSFLSYNAMIENPSRRVTMIIECATPFEDHQVFESISRSFPLDSSTFKKQIGNWPFKSRKTVPPLKNWPSRQEEPANLQLIIEKCTEIK